jgi:hypothetical protein
MLPFPERDGLFRPGFRFASSDNKLSNCRSRAEALKTARTTSADRTDRAIRVYELALEEGIKFFVYGNLDYVYKLSGYNPKFRTGHYDGKGRMGEWILSQNEHNKHLMASALFTTGPYIEMAISSRTIMTPTVEDGVVTWRVPLGDGAVVHVSLEDCGYYVRWLFDHPNRANGMDLAVGIAHIGYKELAEAFEKVTGHKARYVDTSVEAYWEEGPMKIAADMPAAYNADPRDASTMSLRDNFTGFWAMWKHSGGNNGIIQRDYGLLDEIFPARIKSVEEWFRRENERGVKEGLGNLWDRVQRENLKPILKLGEDNRKGKL